MENLLAAWKEFKRGKTNKPDVQRFYFSLEENLFNLHRELMEKSYQPDRYEFFYVRDPKLRPIHKASVRDRVLYQAVFRILYHIFDRHFIFDSFSCRFNKGTHAGVKRLKRFVLKAGANYTQPVYALKCDVQKFFYSIDHKILLELLKKKINDSDVIWLLEKIVGSFSVAPEKGLPLGNVTSQLFANVYLNELDQFVKHILKEKYYLRYCDDFVILGTEERHLNNNIEKLKIFLTERLNLHLHPRKVKICKLAQGIDFLGYVILPRRIVMRTKTKRRVIKRIKNRANAQALQSYLGLLKHCNGHKLAETIKGRFLTNIGEKAAAMPA